MRYIRPFGSSLFLALLFALVLVACSGGAPTPSGQAVVALTVDASLTPTVVALPPLAGSLRPIAVLMPGPRTTSAARRTPGSPRPGARGMRPGGCLPAA